MSDTIFDKIIAGEISADIVYENEAVIAFNDINPQAPTHVLVIPRHRMTSVVDAAESSALTEMGAFLKGIALTARKLGLEDGGYRVVINSGPDAQQTVQYIHAHILGGRKLSWPPG